MCLYFIFFFCTRRGFFPCAGSFWAKSVPRRCPWLAPLIPDRSTDRRTAGNFCCYFWVFHSFIFQQFSVFSFFFYVCANPENGNSLPLAACRDTTASATPRTVESNWSLCLSCFWNSLILILSSISISQSIAPSASKCSSICYNSHAWLAAFPVSTTTQWEREHLEEREDSREL